MPALAANCAALDVEKKREASQFSESGNLRFTLGWTGLIGLKLRHWVDIHAHHSKQKY